MKCGSQAVVTQVQGSSSQAAATVLRVTHIAPKRIATSSTLIDVCEKTLNFVRSA
ncbi:hypothetical protein R69919_04559 [Paraburkholderia gardini]|uniref:Uncharacterized protein n=1 Tax=Paraburkholderia gardini TaxID=2823469 RepID=A0ABN7QEW1_9BURK|nr:hypothetical protein R54767_00862 [Paraburkholderia gardini]CAG4917835.1 hypothetical protein R69919_04559 [Paraburkholderia gardini]